MLKDVPIIPTTESVDWFQYNTTDIEGWPTPDNPYAQPAAFNVPDVEQVLLHLYSKSAQSAVGGRVGQVRTVHEGEHEELVDVRYLLRRLGFFVLTLWAALTLNFFIPRFMPGSPLQALRDRTHNKLSPAALEQHADRQFGFNPHQNIVRPVRRLPEEHGHRPLGHLDRRDPRRAGQHADRAGAAVDARAGRRHHRPGVPARHR